MMQTGLHAVGWGLSRFAIAIGATLVIAALAYMALVFVIVAVQAASMFGQ